MNTAHDPGITLYGITNCDTVRRARAWMAQHRPLARFHDFKRSGVPEAHLRDWIRVLGWEALVNRHGTTWRGLAASEREGVVDAPSAERCLLAHPSLIKRPVVEWGVSDVTVGFDATAWGRRIA